MATANKISGQSKPAAATPADLYTVPAATQANVNIFVVNQGAADTFRLSLAVAGAVTEAKQYLAYDMNIGANSVLNFTGIALAATDKIRVYSTNGTCSFTVTGMEIT